MARWSALNGNTWDYDAISDRLVDWRGRQDDIPGTRGDDHLVGTGADDTFDLTKGGKDTVEGNDGNDFAEFGKTFESTDHYDGGAGFDTLALAGPYSDLTLDAATLSSVEQVFLAAGFKYSITLDASLAQAYGSFDIWGDQTVAAKPTTITVDGSQSHADLLFYGSSGNDTYIGGDGYDFFRAQGGGRDIFDGGTGTKHNRISFYYADPGHGVVFHLDATGFQQVGTGKLQVHNIQDVTGTAYDDVITGSADDNAFFSKGGSDLLSGGDGNDVFFIGLATGAQASTTGVIDGGDGIDAVDFYGNGANTAPVTVYLGKTTSQDTGQGAYTFNSIEAASGTQFDDHLYGSKDSNNLYGGDGADTLDGGPGDDALYGEWQLFYQSENGAGGYVAINDNTSASFADVLFGGDGNDKLYGQAGDDTLWGGLGADQLEGGLGHDIFAYATLAESAPTAPDYIDDLQKGDYINVTGVEADAGVQFHFGRTKEHVGDIVVHALTTPDGHPTGIQEVDFFVDGDKTPDMVIMVAGDHALNRSDFMI